jgi:hypothetical protein
MTEEERCRQTAQNRLKDALVLYQQERYEATLYMCGYVIEIGIKAEFHRLANTIISSVEDIVFQFLINWSAIALAIVLKQLKLFYSRAFCST